MAKNKEVNNNNNNRNKNENNDLSFTNIKSKTHIKGFDELLDGGFVKSSNVFIVGNAGTGKTIFSLEYLYNGAKYENEIGIYFTFEEKKNALIEQAKKFGWNIEELEKKGLIKIIPIGIEDISKDTVEEILEIIKNTKAKRVIIDSITTISFLVPQDDYNLNNELKVKKFLYSFITKFNELEDLTTIFIGQKSENISTNIAKYLCDGVINIEYESMGGDYSRTIRIRKMRQVKNNDELCPMEIRNNEGIIVHRLE